MLGSLAEELGRRRVREVRESSGRLPPKAKYWFPRDGIAAASALIFLQYTDTKCQGQTVVRYVLIHFCLLQSAFRQPVILAKRNVIV